jgi:DNA-binding CsgD family transcriptional regulator
VRQHDQGLREALQLPPPLAPLIADRPGKRLLVRMLADSDSPTLLLEQQLVRVEPNRFRSLGLTRRENQVLASVVRGHTNKLIASELSISPRTVQRHLEHIYDRLGVNTRTAAAALAFKADYGAQSDGQGNRMAAWIKTGN